MEDIIFFATLIVPVVMALVEVVKRTVNMDNKYATLVSLIVGLLVGFAGSIFTDLDLTSRLWAGALAGLSSSGLYDLIKPKKTTDDKKVNY